VSTVILHLSFPLTRNTHINLSGQTFLEEDWIKFPLHQEKLVGEIYREYLSQPHTTIYHPLTPIKSTVWMPRMISTEWAKHTGGCTRKTNVKQQGILGGRIKSYNELFSVESFYSPSIYLKLVIDDFWSVGQQKRVVNTTQTYNHYHKLLQIILWGKYITL